MDLGTNELVVPVSQGAHVLGLYDFNPHFSQTVLMIFLTYKFINIIRITFSFTHIFKEQYFSPRIPEPLYVAGCQRA
jgi:hypothetical protein